MKSLQRVINAFRKLPGVGPRQAERFALYLLRTSEAQAAEFTQAILDMRLKIGCCPKCFAYSENASLCEICSDDTRDSSLLCIVEEPKDIEALEKTKSYNGYYHVLHGSISPIEGRSADELKLKELLHRVEIEKDIIKEIIIATNPDTEGQTTALYLADMLRDIGPKITRLGYGMPLGGNIDYIDEMTLSHALKGRTKL